LRLLNDGDLVHRRIVSDVAAKSDDVGDLGERRCRHDFDWRPFELCADRAQLERVFDQRSVGRLLGDDERLEWIRNLHRQNGRPDFRHGVRGKRFATPHDAIVRRDAIVLRGPRLDRVAGAKVFDLEVDVEQIS
jgi:hypothetical protein